MNKITYIIITSWYPSHKNEEVLKTYLEVLKKYPPSKVPGKLIMPVAVTTTKNGLKTMRVIETKMDDAQEYADASRMIGEMMAEFLNIEGYEYSIRSWSTIGEAMRTIKREAPE
ncbi:MAG: hypothetical protein ACFE85_18760 [Candidatus Hodarchaeota archaeon]